MPRAASSNSSQMCPGIRLATVIATTALALSGTLVPVGSHAATPAESTAVAPAALAAPVSLPAPKLGGYVQVRELAQEHVGLTSYLNRARFSVDGSLPSKFSLNVWVHSPSTGGLLPSHSGRGRRGGMPAVTEMI